MERTVSTINTHTVPGSPSSGAGTAAASALSGGMSQADFLKLMTAQLQAQDPTHPVDNTQFVSQMAQFSQLSATQDLDTDMKSLGSNIQAALQSAQVISSTNLVGREVLVPAQTAAYTGDAVNGGVNVSAAGDVTVAVIDASGKLVRSIDLGRQDAGLARFSWDGKDDQGDAVQDGTYSFAASVGGTSQDTYVSGKVQSVGYGGGDIGTYLQVAGIGGVPLSQVAQIF
jgi:flagellar basal-body rod modification protein FlgD